MILCMVCSGEPIKAASVIDIVYYWANIVGWYLFIDQNR